MLTFGSLWGTGGGRIGVGLTTASMLWLGRVLRRREGWDPVTNRNWPLPLTQRQPSMLADMSMNSSITVTDLRVATGDDVRRAVGWCDLMAIVGSRWARGPHPGKQAG
jgi:hypothetical protein